jgi:hypothetical protein
LLLERIKIGILFGLASGEQIILAEQGNLVVGHALESS